MNRATISGSETNSGLRIFTATGAPVSLMLPENTWPIAPRPTGSCSTYLLPSRWSMLIPPLVNHPGQLPRRVRQENGSGRTDAREGASTSGNSEVMPLLVILAFCSSVALSTPILHKGSSGARCGRQDGGAPFGWPLAALAALAATLCSGTLA